MEKKNSLEKSKISDFWPVAACLIIGLVATFAAWKYEARSEQEKGQITFEQVSSLVQEDLKDTMQAYGLFLRGGVGFFRSNEQVTRARWRQYVSDLNLTQNYPGIQGVSFNAVLQTREAAEQFAQKVRETDWAEYRLKPEGIRDLYTPVLYLEPLNSKNEAALGFDIYSEENRRLATDRAIATGEAAATGKIRLVQESANSAEEKEQAGILVILPVYGQNLSLNSTSARRTATQGLIVSVFRMGDLMTSILNKPSLQANGMLSVGLYDGKAASENSMYESQDKSEKALFRSSETLAVFGRQWTITAHSTPAFEQRVTSNGPFLVLVIGVLTTLLLTTLALSQALRSRERALTSDRLALHQNHVEFLLKEVNHRSKNLLGLVQAIARQTGAGDSPDFMQSFSKRLEALAANQDLLVKNSWSSLSLEALVRSQLAPFADLLDRRILIDGPEVLIESGAAETLGMAFHELATNAQKYGALSNSSGTIDIQWKILEHDGATRFELAWLETGGPKVLQPQRNGFGSKVVKSMVKMKLGADVALTYESTGFAWSMSCPYAAITGNGTAQAKKALL